MPIVITNDLLVGVGRLIVPVLRIMKLPKPTLDAVESHLDELEVGPLVLLLQVPYYRKLLTAHAIDSRFEPVFLVGARPRHIDWIVPYEVGNFLLQSGGGGICRFLCVWRRVGKPPEGLGLGGGVQTRSPPPERRPGPPGPRPPPAP